jgi:hypothetical protein
MVSAGRAICWCCRRIIAPGEAWDMGHADLPGAHALGWYAGPEHRACNRGASRRTHRERIVPKPKALEFFDPKRS